MFELVFCIVLCYNYISSDSYWQSCYRVVDLHSFRMEVMLMMNFDFRDLMAFGTFLIALLTFIFMNCN